MHQIKMFTKTDNKELRDVLNTSIDESEKSTLERQLSDLAAENDDLHDQIDGLKEKLQG